MGLTPQPGRRTSSLHRFTAVLALALVVSTLSVPAARAASTLPPGATVHPRLLFSAADVSGIRARVAAGGVPATAWARLKEKAEGHLIRVQPEVVRANVYVPVKEVTTVLGKKTDGQGFERPYGLQGEMPSYLIELGLAYQVSGDPRYGRHAVELLKALGDTGWPFWTGGDDLGIGDLGYGAALAFDWTYELMTPAERDQIVSSMTARQDTLFVRSMFEYTNEASEYRTSNWSGVIGGGTGLLLLAIKGEPAAPSSFDSPEGPNNPSTGQLWPARHYTFQEYLDKAVVKAGRYFQYGYDALGAGHEGHTYALYGLSRAIPFALAARREGVFDLLSTSGVQNTARWRAFEQLPGEGQNYVNINDSTRTSATVDFESLMFAVNPHNGIAQWNWRRTVGELGEDYYGDPHIPAPVADDACPLDRVADSPLVSAGCPALIHTAHVWAILYYRTPQETPEVDPAKTGPLSVHYDALGLIDNRTGFAGGTHEVTSTFQARRNAGTGHFQFDNGQFTLYGQGGRWAIDPGSACVACGNPDFAEGNATFHNVIVVDGQLHTQSLNSRYFNGTTIDDFVDGPNAALTHADLRYAYSRDPNVSFDPPYAGRDHLFSRVPGRPVVVGIADELERDAIQNPHAYQWQMFTDRRNQVEAAGAGFRITAPSGATLVGGSARNENPTQNSTAAADPTFTVDPVWFNNNTDDSGPQFKISTVTPAQQKLEQVTVMALAPAGVTAPTTSVLRLGGANAVAVDWEGTREVFLRRVRSATVVSGDVSTDARVAKLLKDRGETVMRAGTRLSAYGRDYVTVTGSAARVVVSGDEIQAKGAAANAYRVFAPQQIARVLVNGVLAPSCRQGDYVSFPCRQPTELQLSAPASAPATDLARFTATLTSGSSPLPGQAVRFTAGPLVANGITNAAGVAAVDVALDLDAASYPLTAEYAGDADHQPSMAAATLAVVPDETALVYTGPTRAAGSVVEVSAVLTEDAGTPLAGRTVLFTSGTSAATAVTDSTGLARTTLSIPDHGVSRTVVARFDGTARHAASQATGTVTWGLPFR